MENVKVVEQPYLSYIISILGVRNAPKVWSKMFTPPTLFFKI